MTRRSIGVVAVLPPVGARRRASPGVRPAGHRAMVSPRNAPSTASLPMRTLSTAPAALALALIACGGPGPAPPNPASTLPPPPSAGPNAGSDASEPRGPRPAAPPSLATDADPGFLTAWAETLRFRLGRPKSVAVTKAGDAVLFLRSPPRSFVNDLWQLDLATGEERVVATAGLILGGAEEALSPEEKARRERARLLTRGISTFALTKDETRLLFPLSGSLYLMERGAGHVSELPSPGGYPIDPQLAPDDSAVACVVDGELRVLDLPGGTAWRTLTDAGGREAVTNGLAEFVAQEEMERMHGFWWSPSGDRLLYQENDEAGVELVTIADPMHPEQPATTSRYPRPGKDNVKVRLGLVAREGGATTWLSWDRERYPYLATVAWREDGPLTLVVQTRRQDEEAILTVDLATGATTPIFVEKDEAWLNLDQEVPRWLPGGREFLWTTERDGAWQLEVRDASGALVRALLPEGFGFRRLAAVNDGEALVEASAEPTEQQVYLVDLAGVEPPEQLTHGEGVARVLAGSPAAWVRETEALRAAPAVALVRRGQEPVAVKVAAEAPPFEPNVEVLTLDTPRAYRAGIVRPRGFDEGRRYPVIVAVYGGPHYRVVDKRRDAWLFDQWLADQGYIVVSFDGRGTPDRGRAWERAIKGDLISAPLADQVEALQAAARHVPQMDLSRVGVTGWSFGGYFAAQAVLQRPDVFTAAVAGAPVTEWRDYDTHYTERYLGLPADAGDPYGQSSVLTHAGKLQRPLLLIHGTADDNVYFSHSLKLMDALLRARQHAELLPLAGLTHLVVDPEVTEALYERVRAFFAEHLAPEEEGGAAPGAPPATP